MNPSQELEIAKRQHAETKDAFNVMEASYFRVKAECATLREQNTKLLAALGEASQWLHNDPNDNGDMELVTLCRRLRAAIADACTGAPEAPNEKTPPGV